MSIPVGTIVKLKTNCLGNSPGTIGLCIEDYNAGSFIIFKNGEYDGFSNDDIKHFLDIVDYSYEHESYIFYNVMSLSDDYRRGKFDSVLKQI